MKQRINANTFLVMIFLGSLLITGCSNLEGNSLYEGIWDQGRNFASNWHAYESSDFYFERGVGKYIDNRYRAAIADLNRALQVDPQNMHAYLFRGHIRREIKDLDGAIADYTRVIQLDPNDAYAYQVRGEVYGDLGDKNAAILDLTKSIEMDPLDSFTYVLRAIQKGDRADYDGFCADMKQSVEVDMANDDTPNMLAVNGIYDVCQ